MGKTIIIWAGGLALLAATLVDTLAVAGRHLGLPFTGSIELIQAMVVVSGATGIVMATMADRHARVRLLVDRLGPRARLWADRLSDLLTLVFVACLLAGSSWIAYDLRDGQEQSELLGVPWAAMRLAVNVCLLVTIVLLALRLAGRARK